MQSVIVVLICILSHNILPKGNPYNSFYPITGITLSKYHPVDFLLVGAAKSGTSSVFEALNRHPGIFIPQRKECRYFSCMPDKFGGPGPTAGHRKINSLEEYRKLFETAKSGQLRGDASPDYLYYYRNAIPKILNEIDAGIPIIIVLRNPVDRAYSNYLHKVRETLEELSFEDALDAEETRLAANWAWGWGYVHGGLYAEQVKAYLDNFERVLLLLFEEDIETGTATGKILEFLNLPHVPEVPADIHVNISGYPKNRVLHRLMTDELIVRKIKNIVKATPWYAGSKWAYRKIAESNLKKIDMTPKTRRMLKERFRDDVDLLEGYTGLPVRKFWTDFQ